MTRSWRELAGSRPLAAKVELLGWVRARLPQHAAAAHLAYPVPALSTEYHVSFDSIRPVYLMRGASREILTIKERAWSWAHSSICQKPDQFPSVPQTALCSVSGSVHARVRIFYPTQISRSHTLFIMII